MNDWTRVFLVGAIVALAVYLLTLLTGGDIGDATKDVLLIVVGIIMARFGSVYDYYFGSSSGSKEKTDMMGAMENPAPPVETPAE